MPDGTCGTGADDRGDCTDAVRGGSGRDGGGVTGDGETASLETAASRRRTSSRNSALLAVSASMAFRTSSGVAGRR